jgi:hypothetical protein
LSAFLKTVQGFDVVLFLRSFPQRPAELARVPSATPVPLHATKFGVKTRAKSWFSCLEIQGQDAPETNCGFGFVDCPKIGLAVLPFERYVAFDLELVLQMSMGIVNFIPLKGIPL